MQKAPTIYYAFVYGCTKLQPQLIALAFNEKDLRDTLIAATANDNLFSQSADYSEIEEMEWKESTSATFPNIYIICQSDVECLTSNAPCLCGGRICIFSYAGTVVDITEFSNAIYSVLV